MDSLRDIIIAKLEEAGDSIRGSLASQRINASGRTSQGFRVDADGSHYRLLYDGSGAPLSTLELGRKAGGVPMNFTEIIERWSVDKGIPFPSEKERHRFAGAVAWGKIRREGFGRPSPSTYGSRSETVYTPVIDDLKSRLRRDLHVAAVTWYKNMISE